MLELPKSLRRLVTHMRDVTAQTGDEALILAALAGPLRLAALEEDWLRPAFAIVPADPGFCSFLLHEEADHGLAVFAVAWAPGQGAPPHDHGTWGLAAGVRGAETNIVWRRVDDGSRPGHAEIEEESRLSIGRGEVIRLSSRDIHSVRNEGDEVALSLHIYGRHLNHTGRHRYEVETQTMHPFIITPG